MTSYDVNCHGMLRDHTSSYIERNIFWSYHSPYKPPSICYHTLINKLIFENRGEAIFFEGTLLTILVFPFFLNYWHSFMKLQEKFVAGTGFQNMA